MSNALENSSKSKKRKTENFVWTDDEVELLLNVVLEYKTARTAENVDWETCQSKYSDILNLFLAQYPSEHDAAQIEKEFPHQNNEVNKSIITSKLKAIRLKFRAAVDCGKKSGHGRVVLIYFEKCQEIWGGSPATTTMASGIETQEIQQEFDSSLICPSPANSIGTPIASSTSSSPHTEIPTLDDEENERNCVSERREFLNSKLKNYRQNRLKRKLSTDEQLLNAMQEDLEIKKRLLEKMDEVDKQQATQMKKFSQNMEQLTGCIVEGFSMLRQVMLHPQPLPPQFATPLTGYNSNWDRPQAAQPMNVNSWNRPQAAQPMNVENSTLHFSQFTNENF